MVNTCTYISSASVCDAFELTCNAMNFPIVSAKLSPKEAMKEFERRKSIVIAETANAVAKKAADDKRLIREKLSEEAAFSITYVPFSIAEVAWDYIDTIFDMAIILQLHETKKLCRAIRTLRADHDRKRFKIIDKDMRQSEIDNMIVFQEELSELFSDIHKEYNNAIIEKYGQISMDTVWLLSSVYACETVLKSLFRYANAQEKVVSAILGYKIAPILPT